jgi:dihydroxyacetone kinase
VKRRPGKPEARVATETSAKVSRSVGEGTQTDAGRRVKRAIEAACKALIEAEEELTELDRATGDGDLGASMRRAAMAVQSRMDSYPLNNVSATLKTLGHDLQREMGGSSGPLYGVLFLRCGNVLESSRTGGLARWAEAVDQGCQAISELGGAKPGDRTMLDALVPFAKSLKDAHGEPSRERLLTAVEAAERGAEATAQMKPRLGRSSYLGDRVLGHVDPGAKAVAIWLRAASEALFPL